MTKSNMTASSQLALGSVAMLCGVFMFCAPSWFLSFLTLALRISFSLLCVYEFLLIFFQKNHRINHIFWVLLYSIVAALLFANPSFFIAFLPYLLGILAIINGIVRLLTNYQYRQDHVSGRIWHLVFGIIFLLCGISFIIKPLAHALTSTRLLGLYLILISLNSFSDFLIQILPRNRDYVHRRHRIVLPVLIAAFIPQKVLSLIQRYSQHGEISFQSASSPSPDLEVFIHLSEGGLSGFGHVDLCFEHKVYSYGCYDGHSDRLFQMMSDGTLAIVPREPYIKHCLNYEKKILVGFGISLTAENKHAVKEKIDAMMHNAYRWYCDLEKDPHHAGSDSASALYRATGGVFYKFRSGAFKTYFVLNTNCVLLADTIIGASGIDLLALNGITTPGTYFSFLNDLYQRAGSLVVSREIYGDGQPKTLCNK